MQKFRPRLMALSLALFLAACASSPGPGGVMQVREAEGVSAERLGRIGPALSAEVDKGTFPGAVSLVARNGRVVHFEATGYLDAAKTKPMTKDAIFRMASMTKPLVSVAAMMLVEQGVMKINDPISNWLPELKDLKVETAAGDVAPTRAVTVQDLLRHTAGMVYGGSTRSPRIKKLYEDLNIEALEKDITTGDMLKNLGTIPLA
ncbi:MAG: beta-lactamase family protein, partial [Candidatus Saccharibacteria bacterium]|nr:beta-lactamase family protein [Rhodoferax sp.]